MEQNDLEAVLYLSGPEGFTKDREWFGNVRHELTHFLRASTPASVLAEGHGPDGHPVIIGAIISFHIHEWAYQELRSATHPHPNPKLLSHLESGRNPFLCDAELARANAGDGLNMLVTVFGWLFSLPPELGAEVRLRLLAAFEDRYAGNRYRRICAETMNAQLYEGSIDAGYRIANEYCEWRAARGWRDDRSAPTFFVAEPADAYTKMNSFLSRMFAFQRPRCRFRPSQQEILQRALAGRSDAEIADELCIGSDALKARWKSAYARVEEALPGLLPAGGDATRGPEKRRILLNYLRDHLEEIRPYDWSKAAN